MEQRITVDMLNELTNKQKERLVEQWEPKPYDIFYCGGTIKSVTMHSRDKVDGPMLVWFSGGHATKGCCYPLLSIGQCIGLLADKKEFRCLDESAGFWAAHTKDHGYSGEEPIISLWEAVKATL